MAKQASGGGGFAEMGAVVDGHKRFEPFVGTFRAEVKLWMGPGDPMRSTGVMTNTLELGGRFLGQSYKSDPAEGQHLCFEGRGYWGYNSASRNYEGFWIDSGSTCMQHEVGKVDASGKVWTMEGEVMAPPSGQPVRKRSVITLQDDNRHRLEMFFKSAGGKETKAMEIQYTRRQ